MVARTLRIAALASTCLWPVAALAEDESDFDLGEPSAQTTELKKPVLVNEMSVGTVYQSDGSGRFGRFSGSNKAGADVTGSFHVENRATNADEGTAYFQADGENFDIGTNKALPDASAHVRFGEQGKWDASVAYEGIPYQQSDNFHTVFGSSSELLNGLSARSIPLTNATGIPYANKYLSAVEVGTRRDRLAVQGALRPMEDWKLSTKLEHEHKQGTKMNSFMFIQPYNFAAFAEPVDYDTDRFTAAAAYTTQPFQAQVSYTFSNFTNSQADYLMLDPFNSGAIRTGYQTSQYSLPPSNTEHQLKGQFGLNLTETTRVNLNLRYGLQLQNEEFKARWYEAVSAAAPKISDSAYEGMIHNLYGNIALTSRPSKDWNLRTSYTVDDRDNSSQIYNVSSSRGDNGGVWNTGGSVRHNVPYSFLNQTADLELGYRLLKSTKLTTNYTYLDKQRTYSVTNRNQESIVGGRVQSTLMAGLTSTLGYSRGIRQATQYNGNKGWQEIGRAIANETELGQYNYAARNRDEFKANLNWGMGQDLSVGATARYVDDHFPNSFYGVTDNHMVSVGPDITYSPVKGVTTHFYYVYQENYTNLSEIKTTTAGTSANYTQWNVKNTDTVHTVGLRTDWQVNDRLKLSAENNLSYGNTAFEEASWSRGTDATTNALRTAATDLPTIKSVTNTLKLSGEYALLENVFVGLSGLWERFLNKDYLNAQGAADASNTYNGSYSNGDTVLLAGTGNPSYSVGVLMASTRIVW